MVIEYLYYGTNTQYDVVQLRATLDLNVSQSPNIHGEMTTVIRYHTPYLAYIKDLLIVLFALSDDISLRSVLCLPTLLAMGPRLVYNVVP